MTQKEIDYFSEQLPTTTVIVPFFDDFLRFYYQVICKIDIAILERTIKLPKSERKMILNFKCSLAKSWTNEFIKELNTNPDAQLSEFIRTKIDTY